MIDKFLNLIDALEFANKSIRDKGIAYLDFIEAAEWADRSMIEKVRNLLYEINRNNLKNEGRQCPLINIPNFIKLLEE